MLHGKAYLVTCYITHTLEAKYLLPIYFLNRGFIFFPFNLYYIVLIKMYVTVNLNKNDTSHVHKLNYL